MTKSLTVDIDYLEADVSDILSQIQNEAFAAKWTAEDFKTLCRSAGVITQIAAVATADGNHPIAFGLYRRAAGEAEILSLAVMKTYRKQGVALKMLDDICRRLIAMKTEQVFLEVAIDNGPAIELYEKAGFVRAGLRKNYYRQQNGDVDALILSKKLV